MGWIVVLSLLAALIVLPLLPGMLQRRGVAWTYKAGFPVATYWRDSLPEVSPPDKLLLDERGETVLVRERYPVELFKWPAGVVGRIEEVNQRIRLKFVTDWHTTIVWFAAVFEILIVLIIMPFAPEMRDPATSWAERVGLILLAAVVAGIGAGIFYWMRRRALTKSDAYANTLGFS